MQKVSKAYKESMKSSLRERAYIMISFGLINQEAQAKATIGEGEFTYFSKSDKVFSDLTDDTVYATLEENQTKVDGSMFFLPRNISDIHYNTGIIGETMVSEKPYELTINLNVPATDFRGITVNFGENYPVDFDIVSSNGKVVEFRNNDQSIFSTEEVIENTVFIKFIFYKMKNSKSRVRIYSIRFGYGLVYYNDSVLNSSLTSYISPIGAEIPQIDFSVQLKNYDHYFDVDNPKSAINFFETGQEMQVYYGYQLPDSQDIEWITGNHLLCSEWESDDYTATIHCQDIFRNMGSEYYKGTYNESGESYFNLASEIMKDAGVQKYYIDPRLKNLYTKNPIPRVQHKEALQIIANACRCVLSQNRNGEPQIKSSFVPKATVTTNSETKYSNIVQILNTNEKSEYASLAKNYSTVDGTMFFLPRDSENYTLNTGYVSNEISNENGYFTSNPVITITQEAACMYYGMKLVFGQSLPSEMIIRTYRNENLVTEYEIKDDISKTLIIYHEFDDFDTMKIEFIKTIEPYNRITLDHFSFGDVTDFTMTRNDMTSSPKTIKQELIKEIIVPYYNYQKGTTEESLISEDVTVSAGEIETFFLGEPSYGFTVLLDGKNTNVSIVEKGSYYVAVKFDVSGTFKLEISGYRYKIIERYATKKLHDRGKTIKWENPLLSDGKMANDLVNWLGDFYLSKNEYEYETRGNPEIDVNDIVYQENEFCKNMKVNIYQHTINFNQVFSGKVTARRLEG